MCMLPPPEHRPRYPVALGAQAVASRAPRGDDPPCVTEFTLGSAQVARPRWRERALPAAVTMNATTVALPVIEKVTFACVVEDAGFDPGEFTVVAQARAIRDSTAMLRIVTVARGPVRHVFIEGDGEPWLKRLERNIRAGLFGSPHPADPRPLASAVPVPPSPRRPAGSSTR
jgi:hypothetical protein